MLGLFMMVSVYFLQQHLAGPAHSSHALIAEKGNGAYSHWRKKPSSTYGVIRPSDLCKERW